MLGTKESATLNAILVVLKIIALGVFVAVALPAFDSANLHPFMPHGFAKTLGPDGVERGVMAAAAIIFFAFYGFDAISTAAEETRTRAVTCRSASSARWSAAPSSTCWWRWPPLAR